MSWNARAGGHFTVPTVIRNWLGWFRGFQGVKNYSHSVDPNYPARISRDHLTLYRPNVHQREANAQRTRPHSVMGIQASEKPYPPQLFFRFDIDNSPLQKCDGVGPPPSPRIPRMWEAIASDFGSLGVEALSNYHFTYGLGDASGYRVIEKFL